MQIARYLHAAILVSDLEKAEHFYGTVLGLPKVDRVLKFPGAWYEIGGCQVHLIQQDGFSNDLQNPEKLGRNAHLAFAVEDLDAAKTQLMAHGYATQMSASGRAALFTCDPDGNVIELQQA
jgi:glyoxylase I family protein